MATLAPTVNHNDKNVEVRTSSEWIRDELVISCTSCRKPFQTKLNLQTRRHHCRLCGNIFCNSCTNQRALIPPSAIVLVPEGGKKVKCADRKQSLQGGANSGVGLAQDVDLHKDQILDPDRQRTYLKKKTGNTAPTSEHATDQTVTSLAPEEGVDLQTGGVITVDELTQTIKQDSVLSLAETEMIDEEEKEEQCQSLIIEDDMSYSVATSNDLSFNQSTTMSNHYNHTPQQQSGHPTAAQTSHNHQSEILLYGKGLEERMKLAREPLRVCTHCHTQLEALQEELRNCNSNAMRYNSIDPTDIRRLLNSPLAFTLGHEIRKAAYTLNNLLPLPKRMGAFVHLNGSGGIGGAGERDCEDACANAAGNFANVDGVKIPAKLLEQAKGVAVMTIIKGGLGFAGFEFGTGLVVSRIPSSDSVDGKASQQWSPPCAIGTAGMSWGALIGAQLSDHVFLLMTDAAVEIMSSNDGSFQLGADIGVAVGPVGRNIGAEVGAANTGGKGMNEASSDSYTGKERKGGVAIAPIYTYSLSKGFYAGVSLDGKVIMTRHRINEKFYGRQVDARELLRGDGVATPPAAQPLYDALRRCHAYVKSDSNGISRKASNKHQEEYGDQFNLNGRENW